GSSPMQTASAPAEPGPAAPTPAEPMPAAPAPEAPPPEAPPQPSAPASINSFNPGIAAVLNGFYMAASRDTKNARIPGFVLGKDADLPPRGFSLGESEVS